MPAGPAAVVLFPGPAVPPLEELLAPAIADAAIEDCKKRLLSIVDSSSVKVSSQRSQG